MKKKILRKDELELVKKLCKPDAFAPTPAERVLMEAFKASGIVKQHRDGSLELTNLGADCALETMYPSN